MAKWVRANHMPCDPLGDNHSRITACDAHIQLSRKAASEGAVLLKNNNHLLPFPISLPALWVRTSPFLSLSPTQAIPLAKK